MPKPIESPLELKSHFIRINHLESDFHNHRGSTSSLISIRKSYVFQMKFLKNSIRALAAPASVQVGLYPKGIPVCSELVLEFDDAFQVVISNSKLSHEQVQTLKALDAFIDSHSGKRFEAMYDENCLYSDERWCHIRVLAQKCLSAFEWQYVIPVPSSNL